MTAHIDRRACLRLAGASALVAALPGAAHAAPAAWPDKPIRIVVPYGSGGMGTVFANMVGDIISTRLKTAVYAEYKPGNNAAIGTDFVAKAPADGYTLLMATTSSMAVNPVFFRSVRYDPVRDFAPVSMVWMSRNVLFTDPTKAKTLAELLALGKTRSLNYGSLGAGSLAHLSSEQLIRQAKVEAVHVPFKGQGQMMTEVAGGRLDFGFGDPTGIALAEGGRVQAVAVTGTDRLHTAPTVPTLTELGYPDVGTASWIGLVAPAGTPRDIVERISEALRVGFQDEAIKAKVLAQGVTMAPDLSPDYLGRDIRAQLVRWKKFQAETRITAD